jgi:hypothetical protein
MRHLENVRSQIGPARHEPAHRLGPEVAGEQDAQSVHRHADDQREVVRFRRGGRPARLRREHLDRHVTDPPPLARDEYRPLRAHGADEGVEGLAAFVGRREGAGGHLADVSPGECAGEASGVVRIQMRQQDQWERVDAEPVQAPVDRPDLGPRIDEHSGTSACGQDEGVALADVAGNGHRPGRRPTLHRLAQRPADDDQPDHDGDRQRPQPAVPPQQHGHREKQDGEQHGPGRTGRPRGGRIRQVRGPLGDDHEPPRRPPREPGQEVRYGRRDGRDDRRREAEDGGRCDRRCGKEVRRERDQTDAAGQGRHQGRGGQTGGRAHGQRIAHDGWTPVPPQATGPARCEEHDGRGRGDRQREAGVPGQAGIHEQEDADRGAQSGQGRAGASGGQREQRHRAHRAGPHDAGTATGEHDEADQGGRGDECLHPAVHRPSAQRPEQAGEHDGDVRPGHRGQVRQPRPTEVLLQHPVHPAGVADHEAREKSRRPRLEHPGGRGSESGAETCGRGLHSARTADGGGRPPYRDDRDHVVPGLRQRQRGAHSHLLPGHEVAPAVGRGEQQDGSVQLCCGRLVQQCGDRRVGDQPPTTGEQVHLAVHGEEHRRRLTRLGQGAQRGRVARGRPDPGRTARDRDAGQHGQNQRGEGPAPPVEGDGQQGRGHGQQHEGDRCQCGRQETQNPHGRGDRCQPQVDPDPPAVRRGRVSGRGPHTVTRPASSAAVVAPIPGTSSS